MEEVAKRKKLGETERSYEDSKVRVALFKQFEYGQIRIRKQFSI